MMKFYDEFEAEIQIIQQSVVVYIKKERINIEKRKVSLQRD